MRKTWVISVMRAVQRRTNMRRAAVEGAGAHSGTEGQEQKRARLGDPPSLT